MSLTKGTARASFFINVGEHPLIPGETRNQVELFISNFRVEAVIATKLTLALQVADSGPDREGGLGVEDGPDIAEIDLVNGTLFGANFGSTTEEFSVAQLGLWHVESGSGGVTLPGGGVPTRIATIYFDARDFFGFGAWDLKVKETVSGSSRLYVMGESSEGEEILATDGLLKIEETPVPEPRMTALIAGLFLCGFVGIRRWKRQRHARNGPCETVA